MRGKLGSEFETKISYNAPMHLRHRQTDRQTDTDIVAKARDVYITSRANKKDHQVDRLSVTVQVELHHVGRCELTVK